MVIEIFGNIVFKKKNIKNPKKAGEPTDITQNCSFSEKLTFSEFF